MTLQKEIWDIYEVEELCAEAEPGGLGEFPRILEKKFLK